MRHLKKGKKFHRTSGRRRSFLRNLVNDLIRKEHIETTEVRAKAIRPIVEKMVSSAKKQTIASRRLLLSRLHNKKTVEKLMGELGPRYEGRPGGYVRIMKTGKARKRDGTGVAVIEFVK